MACITDCKELYDWGKRPSGAADSFPTSHLIQPTGAATPYTIPCILVWGGLEAIQLHNDPCPPQSFTQSWNQYKNGFGDATGCGFWAGNDVLNHMTSQSDYEADFFFWGFSTCNGHQDHGAFYRGFRVANESMNYIMDYDHYLGYPAQPAGDAFNDTSPSLLAKGMAFSTYDKDNDLDLVRQCAQDGGSGWWYNQCSASDVNSDYGIQWLPLSAMGCPPVHVRIWLRRIGNLTDID